MDNSIFIKTTAVLFSFLPKWNKVMMLPHIECLGGMRGLLERSQAEISQYVDNHLPPSFIFQKEELLVAVQEELKRMDELNIQFTYYDDAITFPPLLRECEDAPLVLFYKGNISCLQDKNCLAVVGTRKATRPYLDVTKQWIQELSSTPIIIVSGLAYGIDAAAHRAALEYRLPTCAVLGHGLQMIYPSAHQSLAREIIEENGAIISEYNTQYTPQPRSFLERNRIVAGMSIATLVVESKVKGGAMSTARTAFSYGRDVLAIPGAIGDGNHKGCNQLIKQQIAQLVESSADILSSLGIEPIDNVREPIQLTLFGVSSEEEMVLKYLNDGPVHFEYLLTKTLLPLPSLQSLLLQLELKGVIIQLSGDRFDKAL